MSEDNTFLIVAVAALVAIVGASFLIRVDGEPVRLSPWKILAAVLVLGAVWIGRDHWAGYVLGGLGVIVALADTARQRRRLREESRRDPDPRPDPDPM